MATQRRRESSFFEVATHRGTRREGNIDLDVEVVEVLGYGSERLANEAYYSKIIDTVRDRHRESHQKETATPRCIETAYDGLFQVALYLIPPTFSQFSPKEIALFRDLSRMTIVVPIISRADMYTASELNDKKLLVWGRGVLLVIDILHLGTGTV